MKFHTIIAFSTTIIWICLGMITIESIVNMNDAPIWRFFININVFIGFLFISIGVYIYKKAKTTLQLISKHKLNYKKDTVLSKFIRLENIFIITLFFMGILFLTGVIHRSFIEKMSIFD